jgi:hypothetical protein
LIKEDGFGKKKDETETWNEVSGNGNDFSDRRSGVYRVESNGGLAQREDIAFGLNKTVDYFRGRAGKRGV